MIMPLHSGIADRATVCLLKKKKKGCRVCTGDYYTILFGFGFEIFQRRRFKRIITEKPIEYAVRMSEIEILKVVQIMVLKISETIHRMFENIGIN
jgi:hypothetical protein|uniref:PRO0433 n=1 Tax=Homo sapiens TaxID=9606 RepID=Q96JR8_HUMAN|nr:PRO0433 [Homo sapiens]